MILNFIWRAVTMPLKAFFFLLRNPGLAEVEAFRSLIYEEREQIRKNSKIEEINAEKEKENNG
jgi:hypothetical protein